MATNNGRLEQMSMLKPLMAKQVQQEAQLPCLSVRQPWAWLLVNGWKNVENRTWPTKFRGRFRIHASKGMTRGDYDACRLFIACQGMKVDLPDFNALERGGIVGETTLLDCVTHHPSDWFTGPYGFVVDDSKPLPFVPCAGMLGFFFPKEVTP